MKALLPQQAKYISPHRMWGYNAFSSLNHSGSSYSAIGRSMKNPNGVMVIIIIDDLVDHVWSLKQTIFTTSILMEFYREGLHLDKTKYNSPNRKNEWMKRVMEVEQP